MSRPRRRRLLWVAGGLVVSAAAVLGLSPAHAPEPTAAVWQRAHFAQAALAAGRLNAVPAVTCGAAGGLLAVSIPIGWTTPSGLAPTGYRIAWTGTAGSGSVAVSGPGTTAAIPGGLLSVLGSSIVTVTATSGSWSSPVSLTSVKITTISAAGLIVGWNCVANP